MNTLDFVTELFYTIDEAMADVPKHSQASLYPSEVVTLAFMYVLKGNGSRAFYRWVRDNWREAFPKLPTGRGCSGCSRRIRTGRNGFWLSPPSWA